jgi:protein gp37
MNNTSIEWTDMTWNPVTGCTKVSPACQNCYAETIANRFKGGKAFPNGFEVTLHPERLEQPLRTRKPSRIFVVSMGDLFHEDVPVEFVDRVFGVMAAAYWQTFQVLTKRPDRLLEWAVERFQYHQHGGGIGWEGRAGRVWEHAGKWTDPKQDKWWTEEGEQINFGAWPLPNVWVGVTAENQEQADKRIPLLLQVPAAVRFVSVEPMLGPVDLSMYLPGEGFPVTDPYLDAPDGAQLGRYRRGIHTWEPVLPGLDWVICGGESGPKARPMHPDWARSLRDQCQAAGVPFFFKQWGEWKPRMQMRGREESDLPNRVYVNAKPIDGDQTYRVGRKAAGDLLDGVSWKRLPEAS